MHILLLLNPLWWMFEQTKTPTFVCNVCVYAGHHKDDMFTTKVSGR